MLALMQSKMQRGLARTARWEKIGGKIIEDKNESNIWYPEGKGGHADEQKR